MKKVIVLGASGTIGQSALRIISRNSEHFTLIGASCHKDRNYLLALKKQFPLCKTVLSGVPVSKSDSFIDYYGQEGILSLIKESKADVVLNGIAGSAGLLPSWETLQTDSCLALANKETIVMAGHLIGTQMFSSKDKIIPVDSEHSALFYLNHNPFKAQEIILTASGGPFRTFSKEQFKQITPEEALKHPNWIMGSKITIDSASMANKGLEVIEAHYLFQMEQNRIKVVIHPESIVHSFIRTEDNALYAQIGLPDMELPIQNALFYPEMKPVDSIHINPWDLNMSFSPVDEEKFPMLSLAYEALSMGPKGCIGYNAINEIAVEAFLKKRLSFTGISKMTEILLNKKIEGDVNSIPGIMNIDETYRTLSRNYLENLKC